MKKIMNMMAATMLLVAPTFFTSCDDDPWWYDYYDNGYGWNDNYYNDGGYDDDGYDDNTGNTALDEAEVLQGEWDGTMNYTNSSDGSVSSFYANMTFVRNSTNAIKGTGTEIDYTLDENQNVADQQTLKFNWYIDESTGDIHFHYLTANATSFIMDASAKEHGFYLDEASGSFSGYMLGTNNKDMIYIDLKRIQNNEAKAATRATGSHRVFGSAGKGNVAKASVQKLNNRR